jgi:hypothetical protein
MAWRLMWHPGLTKAEALRGTPVSFISDEVASDAEARTMVRQLTLEGFHCISVTASGAGKIMSGSILKRWLAQAEQPIAGRSDKDAAG